MRVIGRLNAFNGVNRLKASHMRLVTDMHEPFFHCLEAMVVFISNQKQSVGNFRCAPGLTSKLIMGLCVAASTSGSTEKYCTRGVAIAAERAANCHTRGGRN